MSGLRVRRLIQLAVIPCLALLSTEVSACQAAEEDGTAGAIQNVSLGFDGLMKPGSWCRVRVALSGSSPIRVEAVTPDPLGNPVIYSSETVRPYESATVDLMIKPGRLQTALTVRIVAESNGAIIESRRFVSAGTPGSDGDFRVVKHSAPTALFCGGFSGGSTTSEESGADNSNSGASLLNELRDAGIAVSQIDPEQLPTDWRTLAAYRTVVLSREFELTAEQSQALEQWVSQGGHLVLATGVGARALAARTPSETATAMLEVLDAGGVRSLHEQTLKDVMASLDASVIDGFRDAGVPELLDRPLDQLPAALSSLKLEPAKSRLLRDTLRSVHRELIGVTQNQINTALQSGLLGQWALRSTTLTATTLSDLTGLETFISSSWSVPVAGRHWGTVITGEAGKTLATGLDGTLLSRRGFGCGRITLCGVALDQSPISRWKEVRTFLETLIDQPVESTHENSDRRRISSSGITELGTQLYAAIETVPDVEHRSTLGVLGLTLLYLLLIGPADYYLVHRLLRKPQLTWSTFPLAVLIACLLGSASASSRNSGDVETRRLELVDLDPDSGFARTITLSTIFSPQHARYEVTVPQAALSTQPAAASDRAYVSWFGFPEANYGGMYRSAGVETGRPEYRMSPDGRAFENLPIAVWSDRIVASEALSQFDTALVESSLRRTGTGQLHRDSGFTHHLPFALQNWVLVYGNRIYYRDLRAGGLLDDTSIPPGKAWSPGDSTVTGRELRSFLTGAEFRFTDDESKTSTGGGKYSKHQDKWDSRSTSLRDVIQMLTFHELAGGNGYTGLDNFALRELELSEHVDLGRAVLLAEASSHVSSLTIGEQDSSAGDRDTTTTFVRILLPVSEAPIVRELPKFSD
ncbi:hypothetical protein GC176_08120 [bacterium]|nr:hypothetical protein [bacterium]